MSSGGNKVPEAAPNLPYIGSLSVPLRRGPLEFDNRAARQFDGKLGSRCVWAAWEEESEGEEEGYDEEEQEDEKDGGEEDPKEEEEEGGEESSVGKKKPKVASTHGPK
jgi:cobalamin biosynthesis protein CobT